MTDCQGLIEAPCAWTEATLLDSRKFIYELTTQDLEELDLALRRCHKIPMAKIRPNHFTLPTLAKTIHRQLFPRLKTGHGVLLLKGINIHDYRLNELYKLHWGLGLYFGEAKSQYNQSIMHIEDHGYEFGEPGARNYNTSEKLWFHNDSCDVTALMCVRQAKKGGESKIVSSVAIHNEMLKKHPDLLQALYRSYPRIYRNIDQEADKSRFHLLPIFRCEAGEFSCDITRPTITNAQKLAHAPRLTESQMTALDVLENYAESDELCYQFLLEPGHILYMNNHLVLHARSAFKDHADLNKKRLLLRLHLDENIVFN